MISDIEQELSSQNEWNELVKIFRYKFTKKFTYKSQQEKYAFVILNRIMQLSIDCMLLLKNGRFKSVYMLQRAILESHVDLVLLLKDEKHIEEMEKEFNYSWAKLIGKSNKDLSLDYKNKGKRPNIFNKFDKAGLKKIYNSYYRIACGEAHGSLASLVSDIQGQEDGTIILGVMKEKDKYYQYLHCLGLASQSMHDVFIFLSFSNTSIKRIEEIGKISNQKSTRYI